MYETKRPAHRTSYLQEIVPPQPTPLERRKDSMAVNGPLKPFLRLLTLLAGIVPRQGIFARLTDFQMAQGDLGLRLPRVPSAIAGATSPGQASSNAASADAT